MVTVHFGKGGGGGGGGGPHDGGGAYHVILRSKLSNVTQTAAECQENLVDYQIINSPVVQSNDDSVENVKKTKEITDPISFQHIKEGILTKIFALMEEMKFEMTTMRRTQEELKSKIDTLLTVNDNISINRFSRLLPISSIEDFIEIESSLLKSEQDFVSLIKYLNLASGETINQLVPSVMKIIMKKSVSIQFSGCGRKKKRNFSATKVAAAVYDEIKTFAATLQFYSSKAYEYVRKVFMNSLPHLQTVRRWYTNVSGLPEISKDALATVQIKVNEAAENMKHLYFALIVDDMSIRQQIEIDGDRYSRYIDYGTNITDNDSLPEAKYAAVFLLVNINGGWKIPVAYYLINSLNGSERANLVQEVLLAVYSVDATVISLTMNDTASNINTVQCLGANLSMINLKHYFLHPATGEKVYIFLDACHMIKLIRNAYATMKDFRDENNNIIKWKYALDLVKIQEIKGLHAGTKLRRRHIQYVNEKMNKLLHKP
ncbi:uncharacterized protein [Mycetomoellerius zeteki]|uniref:uncharacterized protein n=1 Tax=Mycetomoellerius zeteki TaxID=64791 RepID=UPI00084EB945|nr:PREDICTED: uncharacterized protein LOC108728426 [Trachymyrmex zeteki]